MAKKRSVKIFKCPYCDFKGTTDKLVSHCERNHMDLIPEDYTVARAVYSSIHKKHAGKCIICGRDTPWDEKIWKYKRLCGRPECKAQVRKNWEKNMLNAGRSLDELKDPERQKEMIANRKISGKYNHSDGGIWTYTGSYEKKLLEFEDLVMNIRSEDLMIPGPTVSYKYNGEEHFWILDQYYIPFNIAIDVKDGGDNPNKRSMEDYRAKQIAKEEAIIKQGEYNYLRLTNNEFDQFMYILAELKLRMVDDASMKKKVAHINEDAVGSVMVGTMSSGGGYIVNYGMGNAFANTIDGDNMLIVSSNRIKSVNKNEFLKDKKIKSLYKSKKSKDNYIQNIFDAYENEVEVSENYFYEIITGRELLSEDQLNYDTDLLKTTMRSERDIIKLESINLLAEYKELDKKAYFIPVYLPYASKVLHGYSNVKIYEDFDGYYAINNNTGKRSPSYINITDITESMVDYLSKDGE